MKRKKFYWKNLLCMAGAILLVAGASSPALAESEQPAAAETAQAITLPANTSYISDGYSGVLRLKSAEEEIAVATVDSQNRVVVSAVTEGSTVISYWYQKTVESGWVSVSLPVTVQGRSDTSSSIKAADFGLTFASSVPITVPKGMTTTPGTIQKNGVTVAANTLLWVSDNEAVADVTSNTGEILGLTAGTATLYAISPAEQYCAKLVVQVTG